MTVATDSPGRCDTGLVGLDAGSETRTIEGPVPHSTVKQLPGANPPGEYWDFTATPAPQRYVAVARRTSPTGTLAADEHGSAGKRA
jgi:hypothetical protein